MKVSVILCTYNPRGDFLTRVLASLAQQTLPKSEWQLIVVDNASSEAVRGRIDLQWHPKAMIIKEERLGLANARACGAAESEGEILVYVDDDNLLRADYLQNALQIGRLWPQLGAWGGSIVPEYEIEPPKHLLPHLHLLSIREITSPRWSNVWNCHEAEPWGAGLCLRRELALRYRTEVENSSLRLEDRKGTSLLSGGDTDMVMFGCKKGLGMGVFPELQVTHLIAAHRLTDDYIVRISEGIGTSSILLFYKWGGIQPESPYTARCLARFLRDLFLSRGMRRRLGLAQLRALRAAHRTIHRTCSPIKPPARDNTASSAQLEQGT